MSWLIIPILKVKAEIDQFVSSEHYEEGFALPLLETSNGFSHVGCGIACRYLIYIG